MQSYRVAIITRTYPPKGGGIAAAHYALAQCLGTAHEVSVFAFDDQEESRELNVFRTKTPEWLGSSMEWVARQWVHHYAKEQSATNCEQIFRAIPAVRSLNRRLRAFQPDFILCPDNFVPGLTLQKPPNSKLIWIAHHNYRRFEGNPLASQYSWIDLQLSHRLELRALKKADAIVAVSDYMADVTRQTLKPVQLIRVIRNSVGLNEIESTRPSHLREKLDIADSVPIIYVPSAGSAVKGERYTFELIRRLGDGGKAAFFLSGALTASLQFELKQLGPEIQIYAPGVQAFTQNLSDVAACDLTVSPTLVENLSSALIESLALGVPVVTFDTGGNKELIQTDFNGHLSPYLDLEDLVSASCNLLMDNSVLTEMRENARSSVEHLLNPQRVLKEYGGFFASFEDHD